MSTMEKVAILARVSTQGQDYERQVVELTDYCQRMNWEVSPGHLLGQRKEVLSNWGGERSVQSISLYISRL